MRVKYGVWSNRNEGASRYARYPMRIGMRGAVGYRNKVVTTKHCRNKHWLKIGIGIIRV